MVVADKAGNSEVDGIESRWGVDVVTSEQMGSLRI